MKKYFSSSKVVEFRSYEDIQLAVARGAAYQALAIALNGKGFIDLVCHEDISIKTDTGLQLLVPKGAAMPYPGGKNFALNNSLSLPKNIQKDESLQLKLEVVGGNEQRLLYHNIWNISGPARKGDKLSLEYRYDENQLLHLTMSFSEKSDDLQIFEDKVEKPLTNVVNPNQTKQTILIMEEELRQNRPGDAEAIRQMRKIAELYADLGQYEKALDYLRRITTRQKNQPDAGILNQMGIYFGNLKDYERQEKFYRAAAKVGSWKGPLFNLALQKYERKLYEEGLDSIEATLENEANGPYYVLSACLWKEIGDDEKSNQRLTEAFEHFDPLSTLEKWELYWYQKGARMLGDDEKIEVAKNESARRKINPTTTDEGILPSGSGERG
jgi:tetratricopeptide (TPR) repeat protein